MSKASAPVKLHPKQGPDKSELAYRQSVAQLVARSNAIGAAIERARLSPGPVDVSGLLLATMFDVCRSLAFFMDAELKGRGRPPALNVIDKPDGPKGNGRDRESSLVVVGS